jgi:hypothetical protein
MHVWYIIRCISKYYILFVFRCNGSASTTTTTGNTIIMIISDASDEGADVRGAGTGTASASALRRAFSICSVDDDGRASKIECARAIRRQVC